MRLLLLSLGGAACLAVFALALVYGLSEARLHDVTPGPAFAHPIPTGAAAIEQGRLVARTRGCFGCHGQALEGKDFDTQWDWPKRAVAPNLAALARTQGPAALEAAIRQGIDARGRSLTAMPSYNFARLSDEDVAALITFLQAAPVVESRLPRPALGWQVRWTYLTAKERPIADWVAKVPPLTVDPAAEPVRARGEYLAMTTCNECHGLDLRGQWQIGPPTPDLAIAAAIPPDEFQRIVRTGIGMGGRDLGLMRLVAPDRFPSLPDEDIDALHAYLSSLADTPPATPVDWRP